MFLKVLIPYSRLSRSDETDLKEFSARFFSINFVFGDSEISRINIFGNALRIVLGIL